MSSSAALLFSNRGAGRHHFVDLPVGPEGLNFKCFTVNVANAEDEKFLGFPGSDTFRGGLRLLSALQPATALFSATALALTRQVAVRHRNVPVQDFCLGLDFSGNPGRAALEVGRLALLPGVAWSSPAPTRPRCRRSPICCSA
jgi:hypothetical protein